MNHFYDAVIVGGGPAGLSAAIYLSRAQFRVLVIEKEKIGGQITITGEVVNYPGILKTDGTKLTEAMHRQAENFGAEFKIAQVTGLDLDGDYKTVRTDCGEVKTLGLVYAAGAHPRLAGFAGEETFRGTAWPTAPPATGSSSRIRRSSSSAAVLPQWKRGFSSPVTAKR